MIPSVVAGTNADLMRAAAALYIEADDVVVDATYGAGGFWRRLPEVSVVAHDLGVDGVDLRALPEADRTVDVVVLDPPYRLDESTANRGAPAFAARYGLDAGELGYRQAGWSTLVDLYDAGIGEAARVLGDRGRLFVKCQDAISGRALELMIDRILDLVRVHGLEVVDLFIHSAGTGPGSGRWQTQQRARRAHSYLVIAGRSRYWQRRDPVRRERVTAGRLDLEP